MTDEVTNHADHIERHRARRLVIGGVVLVTGVILFLVGAAFLWMRRRGKRTERHLRDELRARDATHEAGTTRTPTE